MTRCGSSRAGCRCALTLSALALAWALPTWAAISTSRGQTLELRRGDLALEAELAGERIAGPQMELRRTESGLTGEIRGQPVRLRFSRDRDRVGGWVGDRVVRVRVSQDAQAEELEGLIGTAPVRLRVRPGQISGQVGECTYALPWGADRYEGWIDCGGGDVPIKASLKLPGALGEVGDAERAAILIALLSAESRGPLNPNEQKRSSP